MNTTFCTIISRYRLHQLLTLYYSLEQSIKSFKLYVLCMDSESFEILSSLRKDFAQLEYAMQLVQLQDIEDERLKTAKLQRSLEEYCWTLKPFLLLYIMRIEKEAKTLIYTDADIYYYADPVPVINSIKSWALLVTNHAIDRNCNGGFVCVKNNNLGTSCMQWWGERCIERCKAERLLGRFGDQGYLDDLVRQNRSVVCVNIPGLNAAYWNYFKYEIEVKNEIYFFNKRRLIFFHFSGLNLDNAYSFIKKLKGKAVEQLYFDYYNKIKVSAGYFEKLQPTIRSFLNNRKQAIAEE